MDQCASVLLAFPPDQELADDEQYDKAVKAHVQRLGRLLKEQAAVLSANAGLLLDHIDVTLNSISYLVLLQSAFDPDSKPSQATKDFIGRTISFLLKFDPRQIRYAGVPFSNLLTVLLSGDIFPGSVAVAAASIALRRLDPTGSMFTSHHLPLVRLAYEVDNIRDVLEVINSDILFYPGMRTHNDSRPLCDSQLPPPAFINVESGLTNKVTPSEVLEYDMLCGLCNLSLGDWRVALDAFERALTTPTRDNGCSKIMVDAHNKWVLVSLLLKGKASPIPSRAGQGAQKTFATLGSPYIAVAKAFEMHEGGAVALKAEFERLGEQFWADDGNLGLMRMVMAYYQRWQIINLQDVYSKISLEEIRQRTQSAETGRELEHAGDVEELVHGIISAGTLSGAIEKPDGAIFRDGRGYLAFIQPAEELSESKFAAELLASVQRIKELEPVLKATNERLAASREYARFLIKEQRLERENARDPGIGFDSQIEDEDLMTGIIAPR